MVYRRIITSGSVGGLNWWPTSEERTAVVPADPQDWADLDVTFLPDSTPSPTQGPSPTSSTTMTSWGRWKQPPPPETRP
ncbi:hypothetical protein CPI83_30095 (plasmid) [Rhodococcus sp. H-CA8f]|nr:hypothetical protein CPI83_30095 [Rhodococcus sp. H-CA8f]